MKTTRFAIFFSLLSLVFSIAPMPANALSGSEFQAGRIIDDSKFFSGPTMSVADIQAFLNAKVPTCDTWGTQPYGGTTRAAYAASRGVSTPFICLKEYRENSVNKSSDGLCNGYTGKNESSAEIIYNVSSACGISVQVLIVLLQKEQALVTDDWPWPVQYRTATGYGCPDTAACDTQYYGFFNQLYNAARQFKRYAAYPSEYGYQSGRNNFIKWHPDYWNANTSSWEDRCGGSTVYIQNLATAGLYNYTPYQPNATALSNIYGSQDDGCSSYGNRNFWRQFNDWFGTTFGTSRDAYLISANNTSNWLEYGESRTVTVTVRNTGNDGWCADGSCPAGQNPTRLVTQSYQPYGFWDSTDPAWVNSAQVKMQTPTVAPGELATFTFKVKAPNISSYSYSTKFYVMISGLTFAQNASLWIGGHVYPTPMQLMSKTVDTSAILPNQKASATVTIRNTSKITWYSDAGRGPNDLPMRLATPGYAASPYYDSSDPAWLTSSQIAMKSPVVAPGQDAVFEFSLRGPFKQVTSGLKLLPIINGHLSYNDLGIYYQVTTPQPQLTYDYVGSTPPPASMAAGSTASQKATITLKNTGNTIWRNETAGSYNRVRLMMIFSRYRSSPFYDATDPAWLVPSQIAMKTPVVNPGENAVFEFSWKAPGAPGNYLEYFSLVMDGAGFFPEYGSAFRTSVY